MQRLSLLQRRTGPLHTVVRQADLFDGQQRYQVRLPHHTDDLLRRPTPPPGLPAAALTRGSAPDEPPPVRHALGTMVILIDYEGFHESVVGHEDRLGVESILHPSHSDRNWEQPAGFNHAITVGEAWEQHGVGAMIQGRPNIQYAIVPMMAGRILDLEGQGCSHIAGNTGEVGAPAARFLLARATSHTGEEIVAATVELPEGC